MEFRRGTGATVRLHVVEGDLLATRADVVLLKYAQAHYGADRTAAERLRSSNIGLAYRDLYPGGTAVVPAVGTAAAQTYVFVGTPGLRALDYADIHAFVA